jgi:hypothetical protein
MWKGKSNKKKVEIAKAAFDGFRLDFLGEFEAIFETALTHESGP